jgi:hypothetical protein
MVGYGRLPGPTLCSPVALACEGHRVAPSRHNKSFDTDAQVRPRTACTRFVCAGQVRR